jgi:hypothetical protein
LISDQQQNRLPRTIQVRGIFFVHPLVWLAGVLLVTNLSYLAGLEGPFLFDDPPNIIQPFNAWLSGQIGWRAIAFGNDSGLLHRPLSMLTFLANVATTGLAVLPFKVTNLAVHLFCGGVIYALMSRLLQRDPQLRTHGAGAALCVTAMWLLHPMQVSTVLYVVQRMAQLSSLFMLLSLLVYVQGRVCLERGLTRNGLARLFLVLPITTLAAIFSKENGALVPLLCGVIELGYFRPSAQTSRPASVKLFYLAFLGLPTLAAFYLYGLHPQRLMDGYQGRLFTFGERLLSEPRALMDYLGALLLPRGPALGVYTDDFVASTGLLDPPSTLWAILALVALISVAFWSRARIPALFTGVGLYLAGHAMESTVFPLELYFEHRNYLPSVGLFLAVVGLAAWLLPKILSRSSRPARLRRLLGLGVGLLFALLSLGTFARASVWSSWPLLAAQGAQQHPQSMRAQLDHANMLQIQGRYAEAQQVFDHMQQMDNPAARHAGIIDSVALQCMAYGRTSAEAVARIPSIAGSKLQLAEMLAFENLGNYLQKHDCTNLTKPQLAMMIVDVVDTAPQPGVLTQLWRSRFVAAQLYTKSGLLAQAQTQTAIAWMTGAADPAVGVYLANLYYAQGDAASARIVLADASKHVKSWDQRNLALIAELKHQFEPASAADGGIKDADKR